MNLIPFLVSGTNCERRLPRSSQLTFTMQFPSGEATSSSTSSLWSNIHSRSLNPPRPTGGGGSTENGFPSAGFVAATRSRTLCNRLRACRAIGRERLTAGCRGLVHCVLRPVPGRVYGTSTEARFSGATAPPPVGGGGGGAVSGIRDDEDDRNVQAVGRHASRFSGASAPARSGERASSNSDSPPYLPAAQPRLPGNQKAVVAATAHGHSSEVRDMAV